MDQAEREMKKVLEQQLKWTKEQARILDEINNNLYKMKETAETALIKELTEFVSKSLNNKLNRLKNEVHTLEEQLHYRI